MAVITSDDFLMKDYEQAFVHMRHYESITKDLLQFSFGYYSAIATLSLGVYQFFYKAFSLNNKSLFYIAIILLLGVIIGSMITVLFIRYRKYFVQTARQVNRIRKYFITKDNPEFKSALPVDENTPVIFDLKSTQLLIIFIFDMINFIFLLIGLFCLFKYLNIFLFLSIYLSLIISVGFLIGSIYYAKYILKEDN